jgi:2,3-bisphosphoglycerate-dependent phosphoglycerate mutase
LTLSQNTIYLVRHGENWANLTKEFSCRLVDRSLTPKGVLQAQQTASYMAALGLDAIYSSPLRRAFETAAIIAGRCSLTVCVLEELREINVGDLEGRPANAADWAYHDTIIAAWAAGEKGQRFPGGEDYNSAWARLRTGLAKAVAGREGQRIAVVGHGGLLTVTLQDLCPEAHISPTQMRANQNCSVTEIRLREENGQLRGKIVRWADHGHLHGEAADFVPGVPQGADWG